jgi:creatinine amidohydrolase
MGKRGHSKAVDAQWVQFVAARPDELQEAVERAPVAYWPLGLIEHHGWHLPVGFDGLKAEALCVRLARRTGGAVLPVMWWGAGGGHGPFKWTLYQDPAAARAILDGTLRKLVDFGFRCVVLVAGHYPWRSILDEVLPSLASERPDVLLIAGTEMDLAEPEVTLPGDHAARWETAYGLVLLPHLTEPGAMTEGREAAGAWPLSGPPPDAEKHRGVVYDATDPCFAQAGEDARNADVVEANELIGRLVDHVSARILAFLEAARDDDDRPA